MSGASDRLARVLALVPWLIAHNGVSVAAAAEYFGVSEKQLESDLNLLIVSGLPGYGPEHLVDIQFWDDGCIHVLDAQTIDRPLRLSTNEAFALQLGLRTLAQVSTEPAVASAMAKLEEAVGTAIGVQVVTDHDVSSVTAAVTDALRDHRVLHIVYAGASTDAASERDVEPIRLIGTPEHATLEAWCRSAGAMRSFRLDRMISASTLDEQFAERELPERERSVPGIEVELELAPAAQWVAERYAERSELRDGRVTAYLTVSDPRWIVRLALSLGGDVTIVNPPEVVESVAMAARGALKAYA